VVLKSTFIPSNPAQAAIVRGPGKFPQTIRRALHGFLLTSVALLVAGCPTLQNKPDPAGPNSPKLLALYFKDPVTVATSSEPIALEAAKNETISFCMQVNNLTQAAVKIPPVLHLQALRRGTGAAAEDRIEPVQFAAYQLLSMPVDLNHASFVRHTGIEQASIRSLPRALLPLIIDKGKINLQGLRDPAQPRMAISRTSGPNGKPVMLWFDLTVPPTAKPGDYQTTFEILQRNAVVSTQVLTLHVDDFVLPDERHLQIVGQLDFSALQRLYPAQFSMVRPQLLSRKDPELSASVALLDRLQQLAQQHRTQLVIPQLQPIVKWPESSPPIVSWEDFDSLVLPWIRGKPFSVYWPLPETPNLRNFNPESRAQYWSAAAAHFDQLDLLPQAPIVLQKRTPGATISPGDELRLSEEAAQLLACYPRVRVNVPLQEEQAQLQSPGNTNLIAPATTDRLITAAPGLVYSEPTGNWPKELEHPSHWLATDVPGLVPFAGAGGDERDVRLWAWLAFLRRADMIQWQNTLPSYDNPDTAADPNELIWFYPGQWFATDQPLPTVHLKWLRRAQQDFEYLYLSRQRSEIIRSLVMARLITKPVEISLAQEPDPAYALMCGVTDPKAWQEAKQLLSDSILLHPPGQNVDELQKVDLNGRVLQWAVPQERPVMLARTTDWGWNANQATGPLVDARLGIDVYNAADERLIGQMQWSSASAGWQFPPQPQVISPSNAIKVYHVRRFAMDASVILSELAGGATPAAQLTFTNELTNRTSLLQVSAPVALCDRRNTDPQIDGSLDDWSQADAICDGPLVRMFNRPAVQRQELDRAATPSQIYTTWTRNDMFIAFKLRGCQPDTGGAETNFVTYSVADRAWGEDLVEVLAQAVYSDNSVGPVLHLVAKPRGQLAVERKVDARFHVDPWESIAGQAIRYGAAIEAVPGDNIWRGEIAIPWQAINDANHQGLHPMLIRFNFAQHKNNSGESASWAGPVDSGRDEHFTGLLFLRDPANPGRRQE
jgi:hypothetical protein